MLDHDFDGFTLTIKVPASYQYTFETFGDEINGIAMSYPPGEFKNIDNIEIEWIEGR